MIKQFKEAVALQPDGIAIYGFPGDAAMRPIINEAREMGIVITTMNTPLPDLEAELKTTGFGYAGADLFAAGFNLGKKAVVIGFVLLVPPTVTVAPVLKPVPVMVIVSPPAGSAAVADPG